MSTGCPPVDEESLLRADPRLWRAVDRFNQGDWYACHDDFEELWHETQGPLRPVLQGLLQIAVAELHLERDNRHGATVLMGEGLGRLRRGGEEAFGLALAPVCRRAADRLSALQQQADLQHLPLPRLEPAGEAGTTPVH